MSYVNKVQYILSLIYTEGMHVYAEKYDNDLI